MDGSLLERLDAAIAELVAIRAELAGEGLGPENGADADDFADCNLLDTSAASARFGHPRDTVALWCRQGCGVKRGGRWMASIPRLQRRINGS